MAQKITTLLTILSLSSFSFAGGDITPVDIVVADIPVVTEKSPFYLGLGVSMMSLLNTDTDEEFTATGATLQIGYQYNEYLALEGRYTQNVSAVAYDTGKFIILPNNDDYPTDFTNMALYLKPSYTLGDMTLYALLGYGEVGLTNIPEGDADRAEAGFQWGVGAGYLMSDSFGIFVDYSLLYSGKGFDRLGTANTHEASLITVGITYRF